MTIEQLSSNMFAEKMWLAFCHKSNLAERVIGYLQVNSDAFGEGWIMKVKVSDPKEADGLLDSSAYEKLCEEEDH